MQINKVDWFVEEVNEKGDTALLIIYHLWSTCSSSSWKTCHFACWLNRIKKLHYRNLPFCQLAQDEGEASCRSQKAVKKIIVASTALNMGVNFGDVRCIINCGLACKIYQTIYRKLVIEGHGSHLKIIYHGKQLSHCEDEVNDLVKSEGCYRVDCTSHLIPKSSPSAMKTALCWYHLKTDSSTWIITISHQTCL